MKKQKSKNKPREYDGSYDDVVQFIGASREEIQKILTEEKAIMEARKKEETKE